MGLTDQAMFEANLKVFEEIETIEDGLGPVYNARACAECHSNPVIGGNSQVSELRAGYFNGKRFISIRVVHSFSNAPAMLLFRSTC